MQRPNVKYINHTSTRYVIPLPLPTYEIKLLIRDRGVAYFLEFYKTRWNKDNRLTVYLDKKTMIEATMT